MITEKQLAPAITYKEYIDLLNKLLSEGKTTGENQSEEYLFFAKINLQRMKRLDKTILINEELKKIVDSLQQTYLLVIITEGWCGDAAQNVPIFAALENLSDKLEVKILLRDENPEVISQYLTNGAKSIPKIICLEKNSLAEKFTWGPRPAALQEIVMDLIKNNKREEKPLIVQRWYNKDATQSSQQELIPLFQSL